MTAPACTVSGCGSSAAYLETSTARCSGWVEVRRYGGGGSAAAALITDTDLDYRVVPERHRGLQTARRIVQPDQADDVARCHACGCTEDDACAGGCTWATRGMQDTCTACAPPTPCTTEGCGTPAEDWDGSDPELWGWICLYVGGSDTRMRWVCCPLCANEAIDAGGAELAAQDLTAATGGDPR
jgi:hypothetical protein